MLLAWLVAILGVVAPSIASAATTANLETRVKAFELVATTVVGRSTARTPEKHREKSNAYDEIASGSPLAAEAGGAGGGRSMATVFLHETGHTSVLTEVGAEALHTEQVVLSSRLTTVAQVGPGGSPIINSARSARRRERGR